MGMFFFERRCNTVKRDWWLEDDVVLWLDVHVHEDEGVHVEHR
jgi:hypothetical protein